jgi:hypothetical protein
MFVNKYQFNINSFASGSTEMYINIPISMDFQLVDQAELVNRAFVEVETEKAINPIVDYEKVRFLPVINQKKVVKQIIYNVNLISGSTLAVPSNYSIAGFTDDEIKFGYESFKQSFLNLDFYDSDNPLTQNLVTSITLFSQIKTSDLQPLNILTGVPGQTKPADQIPIMFVLENPLIAAKGFSEGYHIYDYKDELKEYESKYLYMRASFKNAKLGTTTNMMVKNTPLPIDELIHEIYTRYKLTRTNNGYYYEIDDTYQGNSGNTGTINNVTTTTVSNIVVVNLYQIMAT